MYCFIPMVLTNMTTATIPAAYQGEKVVGLRGNTFSNMPFFKRGDTAGYPYGNQGDRHLKTVEVWKA